MKLEIELDMTKTSEEIGEIFKSLTDEQKKDIAKQVLQSWIDEPMGGERRLHEEKVIDELMKKTTYSGENKFKTRGEAENSWDFREKMQSYKSTRDIIISKLFSDVQLHTDNLVKELVKEDEKINNIINAVFFKISENLPNIIHDIIAEQIMSQLGLFNYIEKQTATEQAIDEIKLKLGMM